VSLRNRLFCIAKGYRLLIYGGSTEWTATMNLNNQSEKQDKSNIYNNISPLFELTMTEKLRDI